jgi:hypothetical protein
MAHMLETLKGHNPASVDICTLLTKPDKLQVQLDIRYCCLSIPNDFIVGYGLDYDGYGRNIKDIYDTIYFQGYNISDGCARVEAGFPQSEERDTILSFIKNSKRGIVRASEKGTKGDID